MVVGKIEDRIKKMKEAIHTQAKQRASHIVEKAEQQADIERVNLIKEEKEKIDEEFQKLKKAEKVKAKIEKSSVINRQRIRKMQIRHALVEQLKNELKKKLQEITKDPSKYSTLVSEFIIQGMLRMMEKNVSVEAPKNHRDLIVGVFEDCERRFAEIMKSETGKQMSSMLSISEYSLEDKNKCVLGGIFLRSQDGLIVCDNSIDARIDLIFEHLLPVIRGMLFQKK